MGEVVMGVMAQQPGRVSLDEVHAQISQRGGMTQVCSWHGTPRLRPLHAV